MNNPEELVRSFIADYKIWNDNAYKACEKDDEEGMEIAETSYNNLISKYCASSLEPQGVAFGSESSHSLEEEEITGIESTTPSTIINTKHTNYSGFVSLHEYHLIKEDGVWKITSLLYVDDDGKYECL